VQAEFRQKLIELKGQEPMDELSQMRYKLEKITNADIKEMIEEYKQKLNEIS
jgi:hypothetical protein